MTLLDYPGRVACTVFLQGCQFRCPFCHNRDLLPASGAPYMTEEDLLSFLKKRVGLLDGVCITGGEPTLQADLPQLLGKIKALGYYIKLDTNGARPDVLNAVAEAGLVEYVAMDIKNCPSRYGETAGISQSLMPKIEESIRYLLTDCVDYEFRTTAVAEYHDDDAIAEMGAWISSLDSANKAKRWFVQCYADRDSVLKDGLHAPEKENLVSFVKILQPFVTFVALRGVD